MNIWHWSYRNLIRFFEFLSDLLGIVFSFYIAHHIYTHYFYHPNLPTLEEKTPLIVFVSCLSLITFFLNDLYRKHHTILNIEETRLVLKSLIFSGIVTFAIFELTRGIRQPKITEFHPMISDWNSFISYYDFPNMFSRLELFTAFTMMFPIISFARYILYKGKQSLHLKGIGNDRVIIYGSGNLAERLRKKILQSPKSGYFLVGEITDGQPKNSTDTLGVFADFEEICEQHHVHRVLVAEASLTPEKMVEILQRAQQLKIHLEFVPALHSLFVHRIRLRDIDGLPLISIKNTRLSFLQKFLKRFFDFFLSALFLIISFPLCIFISLWIKLNGPGPVLFTQKRTGQHGKPFNMYKFRTMQTNSSDYEDTPHSSNDSRITACGRWLRRFSLDELPQLVNILKGDMSLVGPRPEMPFITEKYSAQENERLRIKPGLTGLWQISSDRKLQIHENLDYDLYYLEHQGLLLDIVILLRTIYSVIRGIGAY